MKTDQMNNAPEETSLEGVSFSPTLEVKRKIKAKKLKDNLSNEKTVYTSIELMATGNVEPQYLMKPIFPKTGTAVLAGMPDTGKSQLARQTCIQTALGEKTFLGFELNPVHNRAIYVATEDNIDATRYLVSKQFKGLEKDAVENLRFIFADTMKQKEIIKTLNKELSLHPADLVVIDSFGDIFLGTDTNNNMLMRNTVKLFDKIAKEHNCLVLFVHHINKSAYGQSPSQQNIQGGAGLVQKVRLALQLTDGGNDIRYLSVVKGNYCPKIYKDNSFVLSFSEETFLFSSTGKMIPKADIGSYSRKGSDSNTKVEKSNKLETLAIEIFSDSTITYSEFIKIYCELTQKSEPTAKREITKLVDLKIVEKVQDKYRLINPIVPEDIPQVDE